MLLSMRRSAFTLVELSVVLVIIGLLVGGVLAGKNLIHNAELRSVMTEISNYRTAINEFKTKFRYLPGDLPNGDKYWPGVGAPGNGDGRIENAAGSDDGDRDKYDGERPQFFMQLGLAGLTQPFDGSATLGKGYPQLASYNAGMYAVGPWVENSGTNITNLLTIAVSPVYLYLGICNPPPFGSGDSSFNDCAIFTPEDAWNIDSKIDDGLPLTGAILGQSFVTICPVGTAANTNPVVATNAYDTTSTVPGCNLLIDLSR